MEWSWNGVGMDRTSVMTKKSRCLFWRAFVSMFSSTVLAQISR
jgi:hypothetical protein